MSQEALDVLGCDLIDGGIRADERLKQPKSIPVIVECVYA